MMYILGLSWISGAGILNFPDFRFCSVLENLSPEIPAGIPDSGSEPESGIKRPQRYEHISFDFSLPNLNPFFKSFSARNLK